MAAKASSPLDALLRPTQVGTNRNTGLIHILACLLMLVDHSGKMLFPQYPIMRAIGRMAYPLFAYCIAVGAVYTKNPMNYLSRIALLSLVSQPLYALGMAHETAAMYAVPFRANPLKAVWTFYTNSWATPNILMTLIFPLGILLLLRARRYVLAVAVYFFTVRIASILDYGLDGVHLVLLFYFLLGHPVLMLAGCAAFMPVWAAGTGYTLLGHEFGLYIWGLPSFIFVALPLRQNLKVPRWLIYGFYPAHLALLALIVKLNIPLPF